MRKARGFSHAFLSYFKNSFEFECVGFHERQFCTWSISHFGYKAIGAGARTWHVGRSVAFSGPAEQFSDAGRVSCDSARSPRRLPGGPVTAHSSGAQSHEAAPASDASLKSRCPVLLKGRLDSEVCTARPGGRLFLLESFTELRKPHPARLVYCKGY